MIYHTVQLEQLIWWHGPSQLPFVLSKIDQAVDQAVEQGKPVTIIGSLVWECTYPVTEEFVLFLEEIKKRQLPVFLLLNFMLDHKDSELVKKVVDMGVGIIYTDFWFWHVYQETVVKQTNKTNLHWNADADKFLFLTGKPNKINRVGLLWKLYKKDLLKHAVWSLYVQDRDRESTLKILARQGVTPDDASQFIDKYLCSPDNVDMVLCPPGGNLYTGIPYDDTLYANVKFRVIAETGFLPNFQADLKKPWLTEKTWLTIVNRCPFIMAGDHGSLDCLESLGFRTFKKYLELPDYDNLQAPLAKINAIVTNTASWLTNLESVEEIRQDVEHNYNHFIQLGKAMETDLLQQIQDSGLQAQVKDIMPTDIL